jgi:hypothetical protein
VGERRQPHAHGIPSRLWPVSAAACALILTLSATTPSAWGMFRGGVSAALTVNAETLQPPSGVTTEAGTCVGGAGDAVVVDWTPSATQAVTGYEILRATTSAGPFASVATVNGRTTQTYTDTPLSFATTYYYVLRSIKAGWRSVETPPVARTTRSSTCL